MTHALFAVGALFLLAYVPLGVLAWRRPLLARFALRESIRRRGQFALLVLGLMVGSAAITASLVAGDSSTQTLTAVITQRLGAVDLTVTSPGGNSFSLDVAHQLAADPSLRRYVAGVQAGFEQPASVADLDQRLAKSGVLLVGFDPTAQRPFGTYQLTDGRRTDGQELAAGDVLLSSGLASSLDARVGDHLRVGLGAGGPDSDLRVYGVAAASGPGAYGSSLAVYLPLATVELLTGDAGINVVRVAARGGPPGDLGSARQTASPLRAAVSRITSPTPFVVSEVRADEVRYVEGSASWAYSVTLGFSSFVVLAGVALIVNLVLALAEERRPRLAVLRALGLTRGGLVALAVLEGAVYSMAAAAIGVAVGVAAGLYLAGQFWNASSLDPTAHGFLGTPLQLTVRPGTLALAFAAGALITLGTVAVAAYRTSRMAIAAAIRDLPEPAYVVRNRWPRTLLMAGLAALGVALLIPNNLLSRLTGGVALIVGIAALTRGRLPDRARYTITGLMLALWAGIVAASGFNLLDLTTLVEIVVLGIPVAAIGLTIAASANLKMIDDAVGLLGSRFGRVQATFRPPLAYLSRRPLRTGLATSAFALVLTMVTLVAAAVATTDVDYRRDAAGYDVEVVMQGAGPLVLPADVAQQVTGQTVIPMRNYRGSLTAPGVFGNEGAAVDVTFYVLPDQPSDWGPVYLVEKEKRFTSNAEAWRAMRAEPGMVVGEWANGVAPGDPITVQGPNGPVNLRLAGVPASTVLDGLIASPATLAEINTQPAGATVLLQTRPGSDNRALARQIERSLFAQGVQATSIREILDQDYATNLYYTTEYDLLLHMGLIVGVLALAMVSGRAAIERRRAIGILRSLGYQPPRVMAGLVGEAVLTASIGAMTGISAGILMSYFVIGSAEHTTTFGVDAARLGLALGIVYVTVVIVSGPLAWRVSRLAPTQALRTTG